eukprot:s2663_g11.t1
MSQDLEEHFRQVREHLASQLSFGELELALADVSDLRRRAATCGVSVELLEMLDDAMARDAEDIDLQLEVDSEDFDRAEFLACAGDYLALFRHFALAEKFHRSAGRSHWGLARSLAEQLSGKDVQLDAQRETLEVALEVVLQLQAPMSRTRDVWVERQCCQALFLLENLASSSPAGVFEDVLASTTVKTPLDFLDFLLPFINIAAAAVEALARRCLAPAPWIGQAKGSFTLSDLKSSEGLRALLMHSQAFCHRHCEALVQHWRKECAAELQALPQALQAQQLISSAAALACHCYFVGYCIPLTEKEAGTLLDDDEDPRLWQTQAPLDGAWKEWLVASMYQAPKKEPPEELCQAASSNEPLDTLIRRTWQHPKEELEIMQTLEHLVDVKKSFTPCEVFYDSTTYPPWHKGVECMGVLPMPLEEHLQHLCPSWHPPEVQLQTPQILVAGCGSGHQVAVELRSYSGATVLALDVSAKTVAVAYRKLKETLLPEEFARVSFMVGDIQELSPGHSAFKNGFDLVVCCGVLHHLPDPVVALQRLASVLKPKVGVLQLATYSTLSHRTWQSSKDWLRERDLLPGRQPTPSEARRLRFEVLRPGEERPEAALTLLHFPEFYTFAGLLDLIFHPLERSGSSIIFGCSSHVKSESHAATTLALKPWSGQLGLKEVEMEGMEPLEFQHQSWRSRRKISWFALRLRLCLGLRRSTRDRTRIRRASRSCRDSMTVLPKSQACSSGVAVAGAAGTGRGPGIPGICMPGSSLFQGPFAAGSVGTAAGAGALTSSLGAWAAADASPGSCSQLRSKKCRRYGLSRAADSEDH